MNQQNQVNLYQIIEASNVGNAPLVLQVVVKPHAPMMVGGVPANNQKVENYVLLSCLPFELRQKVELSIQTMMQSI